MDQNKTSFKSHVIKYKYLYIYLAAILVMAIMLSVAFIVDGLFVDFEKASFIDLDEIAEDAGNDFDRINTTEKSKENIFMMLATLPADHPAVAQYKRVTTNITWSKLVQDNSDLAGLEADNFGLSDEAYSELQSFYYRKKVDLSVFGLADADAEEEFSIKLKDSRALVEQKNGAIVGIKDEAERESYIAFELFRTKFHKAGGYQASVDKISNEGVLDETNRIDTSSPAPFFGIFQIVILLAGIVGIVIVFAKSSGDYQYGLTPFFPAGKPWLIGLMVALVIFAASGFYSLLSDFYFFSVLYLIAKVAFDAMFLAFGWFSLRKARIFKGTSLGNVLRLLIPMVANYAYNGLFLLIASLGSYDGHSLLEMITLLLPEAVFYAYLLLAPVFMTAVYAMTNSVMAMVIPMLTLTVSNCIFPSVIQTSSTQTYPIVLFIALGAGLAGLAIALLVMAAIRIVKKVPLPTDLLCEAYAEDAFEVTYPDGYFEAKEAKKAEKAEKARKKSDFAFLDDTAEETKTEDANV